MKQIDRRHFLAISGGFTALATGSLSFTGINVRANVKRQADKYLKRYTLDVGYRSNVSSSVVELKDGTMLWATTDPEPTNRTSRQISRITLRRSADGGGSWDHDQILARGDAQFSVYSFAINRLLSGKLLHIFSRSAGYDTVSGDPQKSLREIHIHHSDDSGKTWDRPIKVDTGERYHGDCLSMEQLPDGRIVFPFSYLTNVDSQFAVSAIYSDDDGYTWQRSKSIVNVSGGGYQSGAIEPSCVRLADGRLWMLIRTQTGYLWESFSDDRGETWSPARASHLPSSNAPATLLRLANGDVAVVWNDHVSWSHARQSLVIGITRDGKTFKGLREIDYTDFSDNPDETPHHVTYAHLTASANGDILAAYNKGLWARYNRSTFVRISPDWITQKRDLIDFQDGRYGWHTFNPGPVKRAAVERYVNLDGESLWLRFDQNEKYQGATGISRNVPLVTNGEIRITVRVEKPEGYILFGNSLIDPSVPDEGVIRLHFNGSKIFAGAGRQMAVKKDYGRTEYSYTSYSVNDKEVYPRSYKKNENLYIVVSYVANEQKATLTINNGPKVEITTEKVFGLTSVGLSVADGGRMCVRSIEVAQD